MKGFGSNWAGFRQTLSDYWQPHRLMLAAVFFTGLAHLAFLPPFEGFDEEAHWSSITLMASQHRIARYGEDRLDRAIEDYQGPYPYANTPPFEQTRGLSYRTFDPATGVGPHTTSPDTPFQPGYELNWQAQHPPLYYAVLSPVQALFSGGSWASQFLVLRLVSWIMAFAGLAVCVEAATRYGVIPNGAAIMMAAWPFFFPQFFPEMARLGNDSLCLFFMGMAMVFLIRLDRMPTWTHASGLALALGLGLWTKAFFLPISAGVGLYLVWAGYHRLKSADPFRRWAICHASAMAGALALGVGWYLYKLLSTGTVTGGDEFIRLSEDATGVSALLANFDLVELLRGLGAIVASFAWAGSWSLARPDEILILPPVLLLVLVLIRWMLRWKTLPVLAQSALFIAPPMVLGLVFHLLVRTAAGEGGGGTPGWYLHILAPVVGIAVAWGFQGSRLALGLSLATLLFTVMAWTLQLSMFSGCAAKLGTNKHYSFEGATCFIQVSQLQALGYPMLGGLALVLGLGFGGYAVFRVWQQSEDLA